MTYSPPLLQRPGEVTITPWSYQSLGPALNAIGSGAAAPGAPVATGVITFVPFWTAEPIIAYKMFWAITAAAGNIDAGIYDEAGVRLVSTGSTAAAGTNGQVVDITDTALARGRYYLAMVVDTVTTLTFQRVVPAAGICQSLGLLEQVAAIPLATNANPATFAIYTRAYVPMFGLQAYRTLGP